MSIDRLPGKITTPDKDIPVEMRKGQLDLVVLQAMAKKIIVTLHTLEQYSAAALPHSYSFEERRRRQHRMIIFAPQILLAPEEMRFVGFVSRRSQTVEPQIVDEIFRTDELMLAEIARIPGLLSYSSLELHPGNWYNLVLFRDPNVKMHVRSGEVHRHAAHQLSPAYYEWIRLHNGTMPGGLIRQEMRLNSTKYYRFPGAQQPPVVRELNYEGCTDAC
ncbi:MAG TPA: hypothetical protein VGM01_14520 [Ktedonobacteraceae bacterium]